MAKKTFSEKLGSREAITRLDELIESVSNGSPPVLIHNVHGVKAVLMSLDDFDVSFHTLNLLSKLDHGEDIAEFVRESEESLPEIPTLRPLTTEFIHVYQFKVTLAGASPPIWRRIRVPGNYTFWDLHVAVQDAMGWRDIHLHEFVVGNPRSGLADRIGIPDPGAVPGDDPAPGWTKNIARYFRTEKDKCEYLYDFGDEWRHEIQLEKILPREKQKRYPACISGRRACPPEDCGGIWEYDRMVGILSDAGNKEHKAMLEWVGGSFDPKAFRPAAVAFDDPRKRLELILDTGD